MVVAVDHLEMNKKVYKNALSMYIYNLIVVCQTITLAMLDNRKCRFTLSAFFRVMVELILTFICMQQEQKSYKI